MSAQATHPEQLRVHMRPLDEATVGEATYPGIFSCEVNTSVRSVARMMSLHRVHCVAVLAPAANHSGGSIIWGLISDLDVMRAGVDGDGDARAGDLARQPVISVKPETPLRQAAQLMLDNHVSHLVVIQPDTLLPMGILSSLDVADFVGWGDRIG